MKCSSSCSEVMLTPEQYAEILCDDLELPTTSFAGPIAQSIRQQCDQFSTDMIPEDEEDRRVIIKVGDGGKEREDSQELCILL